jgi:hypothetical protein
MLIPLSTVAAGGDDDGVEQTWQRTSVLDRAVVTVC